MTNPIITVMTWLKDKAVAANEDGIPIPLIRDAHLNGGTLPGTMFAVSFVVAILALGAKITKHFGDIDYSNVLWLLGVTGCFWVIEALGKKIKISKDEIEVDAETKEEDKK